MTKLPDLEAWAVFAKAAETGSFARAADELGLAKPTVSKAINRLEARLGVALFHRSSRRLALTDAGRASLERAARILHDGQAAEAEALSQSPAPKGRVKMAAPLSFGLAHLAPLLPEFMVTYPEVVVDFRLSDHQVNLIADGFDLALRIADLADSALLSRKLCPVRLLLVAAPAYLAERGAPQHPRELAGHVGMGFTGGAGGGAVERGWRFRHTDGTELRVQLPFSVLADNADLLMPALLTGLGLALLPEFMVWRELQAGALVELLPDWTAGEFGLHLLTPPSPLRPLRVQVLIDFLARRFLLPPWAEASAR